MSYQKDHEFTGNLDRVYKAVLQSGKKGIKATEIADRLDIDRTTVFTHLRTLDVKEKAKSDQGVWHATSGEQPSKTPERKITIKLPLPKNEWQRMALLKSYAKEFGNPDGTDIFSILYEKLNETRTIVITGENVDNLDLEKTASLIKQAYVRGSKYSLRGFFRNLKRMSANSLKENSTPR